jgi:hypothetical protein
MVGDGLSVGDGDGLSVGDGDGLSVGDGAGDGLFTGGLAAAHGVDDGTVLLFPAEAPDEGTLELP